MTDKKEHTVVRDARTGRFVKKEVAEKRPNTTVTETIKTPDPADAEPSQENK